MRRFQIKSRIKHRVSNYNTRDSFITPREPAGMRVIVETGCEVAGR